MTLEELAERLRDCTTAETQQERAQARLDIRKAFAFQQAALERIAAPWEIVAKKGDEAKAYAQICCEMQKIAKAAIRPIETPITENNDG
jgi:hypothetical protein